LSKKDNIRWLSCLVYSSEMSNVCDGYSCYMSRSNSCISDNQTLVRVLRFYKSSNPST